MLDWRWFYKIRLQVRTLLHRNQVERELDEELRYHIEQRTEQEIARGQTPNEARSIAIRAMEGVERMKEECRDMRRTNPIDTLLQDIGYASRSFGKNPAFSAMAIVTLAVGIGASIAILAVVNAVLLRSFAFLAADRLVVLFATTPTRSRDTTSFPDFLDWKAQSHSFVEVAAYRQDPFNVTGGGTPEPVTGLRASHELLPLLEVEPAMGRGFDEQEQKLKSSVALISYGLWLRRFNGEPAILGKTIVLNEVSHTVIGVLPRGFRFPAFTEPEVVVPISESSDRSHGYLFAVGRLKADARLTAAQRELKVIATRLAKAFPYADGGRGISAVPLQEAAAGNVRTPLLILMGAALFVLLIGCANVGNLVLARGIARRRELAVRSALGAGAGRLIRQLLTESVVLAFMSALPGCALAFGGSRLLVLSLLEQFVLPAVTLDWTLLSLAVLITFLCGLLCGLPPAFMVSRLPLSDFLKEANRGQSGGRTEYRFRNLLVITETALTVVLLVGAGLLVKSFVLLQQTELGLNPNHVLMADLLLSKHYADPGHRDVFLRALLDSIGSSPGVEQVAVHTDPPFLGGGSRESFTVEGNPDPGPDQGHPMSFNVVSEGFFGTMGIPLHRGRSFDERDTANAIPVAIVNERMARQFWPGEDPIGKRIRLYYDVDPNRWLYIIGVAGDVRYFGRDIEPAAQAFVPFQQGPYRFLPYPQQPFVSVVLRTAGDPTGLVNAMQARIWAVDKDQPILHIQTMEHALSQSLGNRRAYSVLLGCFAAIALLMAVAGIYGLVAYSVASRTQEIGVRVALGASLAQIIALMLRNSMILTFVGVGLGIVGSLALSKVLSALLYGINATDTPTLVGVALLFEIVACLAAYIPAHRAATIDPMCALRTE